MNITPLQRVLVMTGQIIIALITTLQCLLLQRLISSNHHSTDMSVICNVTDIFVVCFDLSTSGSLSCNQMPLICQLFVLNW